ncbi:nucleotidyl transferase AbiEii/AbiGii toxin family protein [Paenarthrobacter sp. NPDC018779]|uniref:nucleotidyl transferase AbiEii/AbiGii toxin family protein n=1 Tax=Paenarthrobacter sp. NPDC018779 TaxID=3364375 RepID=UPI0037CB1D9A
MTEEQTSTQGSRRSELKEPGGVTVLQRRLGALASSKRTTVRRIQSLVANVILCQMLPASAVKGGTGIKLRLGERLTRQTPDLDTAFRGGREEFEDDLRRNLIEGWSDFTGDVVRGKQRPPGGVPVPYVMQPFTVKLKYHGRPFTTVALEVGYDELAATEEPTELELSEEVKEIFAALGLSAPTPVPVLPLHHQISQKLHACTEPGNQRAHDLVDLQLLESMADDALVASTTQRLFAFRGQHAWPANVIPALNWRDLYAEAIDGIEGVVRPGLDEAVDWINTVYIPRLVASSES